MAGVVLAATIYSGRRVQKFVSAGACVVLLRCPPTVDLLLNFLARHVHGMKRTSTPA